MTTRERINCERQERDAIAWHQYRSTMRYWDDARPDESPAWSCESCGHPGYTEHHSILGGAEQHWITCDQCGAPAEFPADRIVKKPVQFEFMGLSAALQEPQEPPEPDEDDDYPEAA